MTALLSDNPAILLSEEDLEQIVNQVRLEACS